MKIRACRGFGATICKAFEVKEAAIDTWSPVDGPTPASQAAGAALDKIPGAQAVSPAVGAVDKMVAQIQSAMQSNPALNVDAEIEKMLASFPDDRKMSFHNLLRKKLGL